MPLHRESRARPLVACPAERGRRVLPRVPAAPHLPNHDRIHAGRPAAAGHDARMRALRRGMDAPPPVRAGSPGMGALPAHGQRPGHGARARPARCRSLSSRWHPLGTTSLHGHLEEKVNVPDTDLAPCQVCGEALDACTEQRRLTFERCCPACRARDTHTAAAHQAGHDDGSRSRAEMALIRTLADIDDGHLSLWIRGRFFDEHTGRPLDPRRSKSFRTGSPTTGFPTRAAPGGAPWWTGAAGRCPSPAATPCGTGCLRPGRPPCRPPTVMASCGSARRTLLMVGNHQPVIRSLRKDDLRDGQREYDHD